MLYCIPQFCTVACEQCLQVGSGLRVCNFGQFVLGLCSCFLSVRFLVAVQRLVSEMTAASAVYVSVNVVMQVTLKVQTESFVMWHASCM